MPAGATHKLAVKCDLCKGIDGGPACVRACPTGAAIRVTPADFLDATAKLAMKATALRTPAGGTGKAAHESSGARPFFYLKLSVLLCIVSLPIPDRPAGGLSAATGSPTR